MKPQDPPTVKALNQNPRAARASQPLDAAWLKTLCRDAGADDVGLVEIERASLAGERGHATHAMSGAKMVIGFVSRMNREPIRSPARSAANLEFHHVGDEVNQIARRIVTALEQQGVRAMNPSMGFPMEMDAFPGRLWIIQHKTIAEAAGLGRIGIHRNIIHPKFGNFVLLGSVLVEATATEYDQPIDYNPCLDCKLCVAACPVGAIKKDGGFDFSACYTHNYREFMGGFSDWVGSVVESKDTADYRRRVRPAESASMWQSLSFGANYKAAYCLSVCPAGEDVIAPFLEDRGEHVDRVVKPLIQKEESIYVVPGTDAEEHVRKRFPHKEVRHVGKSLVPTSIAGFFAGLPLVFQAGQAKDLSARYHFTFTGSEPFTMTVHIDRGALEVKSGHEGVADLRVTADSDTWLRFLAGDQGIVGALLRRKIRLKGNPKWLLRFGGCFA